MGVLLSKPSEVKNLREGEEKFDFEKRWEYTIGTIMERIEDVLADTNRKINEYLRMWKEEANPDRGAEKLNLFLQLANDTGQHLTLKVKKEGVLHPDNYLDKPAAPELWGREDGDFWIFEIPSKVQEAFQSPFILQISSKRSSSISFDERLRYLLKGQYEIARFESKYVESITVHI